MKQTDAVYAYMETHGSIDPVRAFKDLGCMRLGARIFELKAAGVDVRRQIRTNPDTGKRWAEYWLA